MYKNLLMLSLFFFVGCASTYKDFKREKVKGDEGIVIGRVNIIYKGSNFNEQCMVCLQKEQKSCMNLTGDGYVFKAVKLGEASLSRIQCKDVSIHHYNIYNADYKVKSGVNYIGDVTIDWVNSGGFKASSMFGLVGALVDQSTNDGAIKMRVSSKGFKKVSKKYKDHVGDQKVVVKKSIVSVGN